MKQNETGLWTRRGAWESRMVTIWRRTMAPRVSWMNQVVGDRVVDRGTVVGAIMGIVLLSSIGTAPLHAQPAQDFYAYWGDGKAELSSYRVVQPRYGEIREGTSVLIFVTEEINRRTLVKVESDQPTADRVYTLKLNNTLNFLTGIYPYSVMTSVFSAVEGGPAEPGQPFEPRKVSLSVQEWCGHVFEEAKLWDGEIRGDLNSYFEREGKGEWELDRPDDFVSEDHLPIEIRELKGDYMVAGETRTVEFLPSLWQLRRRHVGRELVEGTLHKGQPEVIQIAEVELESAAKESVGDEITTPGDAMGRAVDAVATEVETTDVEATPWTWRYGDREVTMWVEAAYPRRILRWQDNEGGMGELLASMRLPYWQLNRPGNESYRGDLKIP